MSNEITFDDIRNIDIREIRDGIWHVDEDELDAELERIGDMETLNEGDVVIKVAGDRPTIHTVESVDIEEVAIYTTVDVKLSNAEHDQSYGNEDLDRVGFWRVSDELVTDGGEDVEETMAKESFGLNKILDELRDAHGEPVAEDENMIVFADTHGHELGEIEAHTDGVNYDDVSQWMHKMARKLHDRDRTGGDAWSVADPVVVLKWNAGENPHLQNVKEEL